MDVTRTNSILRILDDGSRPETIEVMAREPAVCPQLHLPLQAGSDRVLALMHRGYTSARYLERLMPKAT